MSCLCDQCAALCCRYFVLEIDKPHTRRQFDDVRWYLVHENTFVFIEKRRWYLGVYARCKHLEQDNRCGIYEKRPRICRDYSTENCDYHGGEYDWEVLFSSAEQLERYAKEWLAKERLKRKRSEKRAARSDKKTRRARRRKPPRLHVTLLAGGPDRPMRPPSSNGNDNGNGYRNANGKHLSLPLLRG
jgi:Fe-S-cluster containining protein